MRVPSICLVAAGLLVLAVAAPASAAAPSGGKIEIVLTVTDTEIFDATGPFCATGTATSSDFKFAGGGRAGTFHLVKTFQCDAPNGADTLTITVNAATANGSPQDQGGWSVISGTGRYANARGGGNIVGYYFDGGIEDHYTGVLSY